MKVTASSRYVTGATVYFCMERRAVWWIGEFRLLGRQARTWRAGHQTRGKGSCGDEGRGAGPQTSHLPPLLPRDLQGMGTLLVASPKFAPSHPPPPILSVRSVYRPPLFGLDGLFSHLFPPPLSYGLLLPNLCLFLPVFLLCCVLWCGCTLALTLPKSKNIFSNTALIHYTFRTETPL